MQKSIIKSTDYQSIVFLDPAPVWRKGANSGMGDSGATICERQDTGGRAEVQSRDGAGPATVILAAGEDKKELFAVKGLKRHFASAANLEEPRCHPCVRSAERQDQGRYYSTHFPLIPFMSILHPAIFD